MATVAGVLAVASACTMKGQEAPPLTGPSEMGQSVSISVSPDVLPQDGASQSVVTITVRDANSQPIRNLTMRTETRVGGTPVDFGSLSSRSVVTGSDGRATIVYTAPPSPAVSADPFILVDVVATPFGSDYNNSNSRSAAIRLVPQGTVIPPGDLKPAFTMTPSNPSENQAVLFDASTSTGSIAEYSWDFGDGDHGTGRTTDHDYAAAGTYVVRLTVSDAFGRSASTSQSINVGAGTQPTADFVFSPLNPLPTQQIFFNASASRPAPGRSLVSYRWDFGDGQSGTGVQPSHAYAAAGTYNVTLVVTDDVGRTMTSTKSLTVLTDNPIALFTFAPSSPGVNQNIAFNGSSSTAVPGRSITGYSWNFGDGTSANGVAPTKFYTSAGTRNVTLTVTDNTGKTGSVTVAVTVQ